MSKLTLEQIVLFKHLLKVSIGEAEPLNNTEIRHYILGSGLIEQLEQTNFGVEGLELDDLPKLKESTLNEVIFETTDKGNYNGQ